MYERANIVIKRSKMNHFIHSVIYKGNECVRFSECCCVSRFFLSPNPQLGSVYTKDQRIFGSFTVLFRCIYVDVVCGFILLSLLASDFFPLSFLSFVSHVFICSGLQLSVECITGECCVPLPHYNTWCFDVHSLQLASLL